VGKASFLSFFMVLAEISSGVKEFFRNDGAMMRMVSPQKKMGSPAAPAVAGPHALLEFGAEGFDLVASSPGTRFTKYTGLSKASVPITWGVDARGQRERKRYSSDPVSLLVSTKIVNGGNVVLTTLGNGAR
jgi:hypothetical protein